MGRELLGFTLLGVAVGAGVPAGSGALSGDLSRGHVTVDPLWVGGAGGAFQAAGFAPKVPKAPSWWTRGGADEPPAVRSRPTTRK
jgi:hypothetical protein